MNHARGFFSLTTIGDRLYATGGYNPWTNYQTFVESFSHETGWVIEDTMELPSSRAEHCSVALGSRLVVLGGRVGGDTESSSVQAFDTSSQALRTIACDKMCKVFKKFDYRLDSGSVSFTDDRTHFGIYVGPF